MINLYLPKNHYTLFIFHQLFNFFTMNKSDLVDKIAEKSELSKAASKKALDASLEAIKEALAAGDKVALIGFGTFSVATRPAHEGINPSNKEKIMIAEKKIAKFKAGADLADAL